VISSFNPTGGKVGDPVTINGTSFTGRHTVLLDALTASGRC
jgi:hypothetical protein